MSVMAGFEKIIGNEQIKKHLCDAIAQNKVSHGYILSGEDGLGKLTFAKTFAQMLQCESEGDRPCGSCHSCKQFESGNHPDIIYVSHEKNVIGVDDVREQINKDIIIKPYSSPYKIYIVDEAEKMSVQAQNALLKTIEEPPAYAIIMLLSTDGEKLLPTIRSRCITLKVRPVTDEEMMCYLKEHGVEEERVSVVMKLARGNIGRALKMAQSESFHEMIDMIIKMLENVWKMDLFDIMNFIERLNKYKINIYDCFDFMRLWFRDVLLFKATSDMNLLIFKNNYKSIYDIASKCSYEKLENILKAIDVAERRLNANVNFEQTLELMLFAFH